MDTSYLSLAGKVALVTGGSRGIGEAIALAIADAGADIVISSRKQAPLEEVAAKIRALGRRALPVTAHNREPDDLRRLIEQVQVEFGRLDILVNNAVTNPVMGSLMDVDEKAFDAIMDTNVRGYLLLSQMAARMMIAQGGNSNILNISSVGGVTPMEGLGAYCISKAAINMLTRVMAVELGRYNIRVNALAPGIVKTRFSQALWDNEAILAKALDRTPLQRIARPEEMAHMALAVVSDAASYITGQVIVMDGGASI
jgi:dehydrogenase/reductase SDR family member 4